MFLFASTQARSLRAPRDKVLTPDGEILSANNMNCLVGLVIVGRQTCSEKKLLGEVKSVRALGKAQETIVAKILWDNTDADELQLMGPGRCAYWDYSPTQLPLLRRAGPQVRHFHVALP